MSAEMVGDALCDVEKRSVLWPLEVQTACAKKGRKDFEATQHWPRQCRQERTLAW